MRPLWALEELGLDYELVKMSFPPRASEGYLDINPLGTVPTFTDGDIVMTESSAIPHYLVEKYLPESPLRIRVEEPAYGDYLDWTYRSDTTFTFPQALFLRYSKFETAERLQPQVAEDYTRWFFSRARIIEATLSDGRDYLCADRFTMADICVVYALYLARRIRIGQLSPLSQAYLERSLNRPAFKRAEEKQADMTNIFTQHKRDER
jgi:glutathione S-transferase